VNEKSQRQNTTEGSSYPSVTQAVAPQDYYYTQEKPPQRVHRKAREGREEQDYDESSFRPSFMSQNPDREGNVVDIAEGFTNSPMMAQFSDHSQLQRKPYTHLEEQEHDNSRGEDDQEYSDLQDSTNYDQYLQNKSSESMYVQHQYPENNYHQHLQHNNQQQTCGVGSNSNANYSR